MLNLAVHAVTGERCDVVDPNSETLRAVRYCVSFCCLVGTVTKLRARRPRKRAYIPGSVVAGCGAHQPSYLKGTPDIPTVQLSGSCPPGVEIKTECSSATIPTIRLHQNCCGQTDENREPSDV